MNDTPRNELSPQAALGTAIHQLFEIVDSSDPSGPLDQANVSVAFDGLQCAQNLCYGLAHKSGWWIDTETGEDVRNWPKKFLNLWVASKLMLVVTEVAEAMEGHRKDLPDDKLPHRRMLEVELADALIRIFDLAGGLGFDIAGAVIEKLAFNQHRPDHKLEARTAAGGKSI